jgi:NAD(P)-dependent dehydrogenase (short-subunit alcohol dehydrogenase family)
MGRLTGKVAVITGATSGIGAATARVFAREGASVVVSGRADDRGTALAAELGEPAFFHRADVTREADIAALLDAAADRFGRVDCLFSNAGGPTPGGIDTITEEQLDYGMRLLVGSVLFGIKHAARVMRPGGGGSIINNSSIAAHRRGQGNLVYSAAKAAVSHVTRLAGAELGPQGIRVNAISPGAIATPIFWGGSAAAGELDPQENARKQAKLEQSLAGATPTPRSGFSDDIAYAALFLASDEGSFINAHDLVVDGGRISMFVEPPRLPAFPLGLALLRERQRALLGVLGLIQPGGAAGRAVVRHRRVDRQVEPGQHRLLGDGQAHR